MQDYHTNCHSKNIGQPSVKAGSPNSKCDSNVAFKSVEWNLKFPALIEYIRMQ